MSRVFNGSTSNYLQPVDNAAYALSPNAISFATWLKRTAAGGSFLIFARQVGAAYYFRFDNGDHPDAEGTNGKVSTTAITNDGNWHHVAFTSDGSGNWVWYVDGASAGSGSGFAYGGPDNSFKIGLELTGKMAYTALWNTALTGGNVTTLQSSATPESVGSGCVASWHLNTSALTDSSVTTNDLVVHGTVTFDSDNPTVSGGGGAAIIVVGGLLGQ